MPGVTEEQITAAKQMSAIEFLRRYRPGQLVKAESRGEFQLKEHDSFKINETTSLWHWKSRDVGGNSHKVLRNIWPIISRIRMRRF